MEDKRTFFILMVQRLFLGFATALLLYILSAYFVEVSAHENVGAFFLVVSIAVLIILLMLHKVIARIGRAHVLLLLLGVIVVLSGILVEVALTPFGAGLVMLYMMLSAVTVVVFDMIIESFSTDARDGRMHGAMLSAWSAGFLAGPIVAGTLVEHYLMAGVFIALLIVYALLFVIAAFSMAHLNRLNHVTHDGVARLMKRAWRKQWFRRSYILAVTLQFFYAVMVVYTPLYLLEQGFSLMQIGTIFTVMLVPFVLIEYPAGVLADTVLGEREMLLWGISIMIVSVGLMIFAPLVGILMWTSVLFLSRIGAALLESMSDIFFYKHVEGDEIGLIDLYKTAPSAGYILAMTAVAPLLVVSSNNLRMTFVIVLGVLIFGLCTAWRMHDTRIVAQKR